MPGGTVEQQKIEKLQKVEQELLGIIQRTNNQNDHAEYVKALRLLNQIQLKRINLEVQDLR